MGQPIENVTTTYLWSTSLDTAGNLTNDDDPDLIPYKCIYNEDFKYILIPVSYSIVFCLGLILNCAALYIFVFRMRPWNASTTYMFNLAISDMLYVVSLPLLAYYYSKENHWPFGKVLCKLVRFSFYSNLYCSIFILFCISIHRFVGIRYPIESLQWRKVRYARIVCLCVWVIIIGSQCPILYFVTISTNGDSIVCHDTSSIDLFDQFIIYSAVKMAVLFCVPFIIIIVCYCLIVKTLMQPSVATSQTSDYRKKSIRMIVIVSGVFVVCFLPFHITQTLYYSFRKLDLDCETQNAMNIAYKVTRPLASANSCLNPCIYLLAGKCFGRRPQQQQNDCNP
ncbi:hypothetical protein NDU88_008433 [Pleurodeles waltl]|uniref:P2Y purinoceptor 2 n=1 Tax=Pleurodeles waltl TaxID=8319 RepID=A0AAV7P0A2_PLEWA|nr:hypothetical protein NDU88_008433 [Pleurodeles waltl]